MGGCVTQVKPIIDSTLLLRLALLKVVPPSPPFLCASRPPFECFRVWGYDCWGWRTPTPSKPQELSLCAVYHHFNDLSLHTDLLRLSGLPAPLITRPVHDLREMISAFEKLRVFSDYRTPCTIRSFVKMSTILVTSMSVRRRGREAQEHAPRVQKQAVRLGAIFAWCKQGRAGGGGGGGQGSF